MSGGHCILPKGVVFRVRGVKNNQIFDKTALQKLLTFFSVKMALLHLVNEGQIPVFQVTRPTLPINDCRL